MNKGFSLFCHLLKGLKPLTLQSHSFFRRRPETQSSFWPIRFFAMWGSRRSDNDNLIDELKRSNILKSFEVERAMRTVLRENYVRSAERYAAYYDSPQPIGYGQTISAPHMHAMALELLKDFAKPGAKALDVGSGSGYLAACLAVMVGPRGKVIGIDCIPELVQWSIENVKKDNPDLLKDNRLVLMVGDGWLGVPSEAPFDAIHVGAAATSIPQALIDQLAVGGRMVIPVGQPGAQVFMQVDKIDANTIHTTEITSVAYVPLVKDPKISK
jgi:protein-L-isoaspartate(D-aspartate) O-methyltransferase